MRFRTCKIARGRRFLKKAPSPGPPSTKTLNIWVLTIPVAGRYRKQSCLKVLVEGMEEATSFKKGSPRILTFLTAHWHQTSKKRSHSSWSKRPLPYLCGESFFFLIFPARRCYLTVRTMVSLRSIALTVGGRGSNLPATRSGRSPVQ